MDDLYRQPLPDKYANSMSTASLVLGITSVVTCTCIYLSIVCGSLAMILALLSRGGKMTFDHFAKAGLILGAIGLTLTILFFAYSVCIFLTDPNYRQQLEELLREYCETYGYDFEELYGNFFPGQ